MKYFLLLISLCCAGCTYGHRVVNVGGRDLYAVDVRSAGKTFGHGRVSSGTVAGYEGAMRIVKTPAPTISWRNEEGGVAIERRVTLERQPGSRWIVVFELDGTNVVAHMESR